MSARDVARNWVMTWAALHTEAVAETAVDDLFALFAAAGFVVVPVELLTELADDLECEITANSNNERVTRRDMEPVYRARAMFAASTKETGDEG
jgi:hypothetical protein